MHVVREPTEVDYDLDHVALFSGDPEGTANKYLSLGFHEADPRDGVPRVELGGAFVEFHRGDPGDPESPLLNHLAILVDRADDAKELPAEVADVVDAPNTLRGLRLGARAREARVRRAQADVLARLGA